MVDYIDWNIQAARAVAVAAENTPGFVTCCVVLEVQQIRRIHILQMLAKGASAIAVSTSAGQVFGTADAAGRQPLVDPTAIPAKPSCMQVASLDDIAQPRVAATKSAALDYNRYPVVAMTYLLAYRTGYDDVATTPAVKLLLKAPYDYNAVAKTGLLKSVKTIGGKAGYQPLNLTPSIGADVTATDINPLIDACVQ